MASRTVFKEMRTYEQKTQIFKKRWILGTSKYKTTSQKESLEIVFSMPAEKNTLSARHARHTARIAPKP